MVLREPHYTYYAHQPSLVPTLLSKISISGPNQEAPSTTSAPMPGDQDTA